MVWPDLVVIEAVSALVFTLLLLAMSILVDAPLLTVANPTRTPNPSKAPWYFLNLQELLLHMDAALAGVFVPGGALVLLAAIPYIDKSPLGQGVYWYTQNSKRVAWFSAIYTTILVLALILIDEPPRFKEDPNPNDNIPPEARLTLGFWPGIGISYQLNKLGAPTWLYNYVIPIVVMIGLSALLVYLVRRLYNADTREIMVALFTGFVVSYVILTISGTAFRGHGMELFWPWQIPRVPEGASIFGNLRL
jgi:quinol-cytochrome oxidoreductase complex cytochrome b subunit